MHKTLLFSAALLLLAASFAAAQSYGGVHTYDSLVARARTGDTTVDFGRMRMAYTETPLYDPYNPEPVLLEKEMTVALNADSAALALALAQRILDSNYANLNAHFASSLAYRQLRDTGRMALHHTILMRLIMAIAESGDGKSAETAWKVISVREEYFIVMMSGLTVKSQELATAKDGSPVDKLSVVDEESRTETTLYFNVAIPMEALTRAMEEVPEGTSQPKR